MGKGDIKRKGREKEIAGMVLELKPLCVEVLKEATQGKGMEERIEE